MTALNRQHTPSFSASTSLTSAASSSSIEFSSQVTTSDCATCIPFHILSNHIYTICPKDGSSEDFWLAFVHSTTPRKATQQERFNPATVSDDDKHGAQSSWDELLKSLSKYQTINKDEIFAQLTATKQELYFSRKTPNSSSDGSTASSFKPPTSPTLWKLLISSSSTDKSIFECYETIITNTIIHTDNWLNTLTYIVNKIANHLEHIKLNQVVIAQWQQHTESDKVKEGKESLFFNSLAHVANTAYHAANVSFTECPLFSPLALPTSPDSSSFSLKILTGLSAYNPECDANPEPFFSNWRTTFILST
ncbi:hypothetical protein QOT17_015755 [Balamuthia mandrillaris]